MKKVFRRKEAGLFKSVFNGINFAIEKEHNLIYIMVAALIVIIMAIILPVTFTETIIVVILVGLLMAFELLNTSIEATVDLITTKENLLARIAKDTSSAAEFIIASISVIVTLIIFVPKIIEIIKDLI